jgi:type IV pilus modification protein PilV
VIRSCLGEQLVTNLQINRVRKCTGFNLIEVLVATTVFSLGLAGLAALLLVSVSGSADARREGFVTMAAASLAEQIRLNPNALNQYLNPPDSIPMICMGAALCSPQQQANYDFGIWQIELADAVKSARGLVCHDATPKDGIAGDDRCDGSGPLVIKIFWSGRGNGADAESNHRLTLEVS